MTVSKPTPRKPASPVKSDKETEITLPESPKQELTESDLPKVLNVVHKKSGNKLVVNRRIYLANPGQYELA